MIGQIQALLTGIKDAEAVAAAAVVDPDGLLLAGVPENSADVEELAAVTGGLAPILSTLGASLDLGEAGQAILEYSEGTILLAPLTDGYSLLLVADPSSSLGHLRLVLRRYSAELKAQLAAS